VGFQIEESFRVEAPVETVWAFLVDPERVVECLPGAELTGVVDEDTVRGRIRVSVGPVKAEYAGTATFADVDDDAHRVRIEATGEEAKGPGSASMTMESTVTGAEGGAEVRVTADVEVAGKIVQFGRGMIQTVSQQLFRKFTECARSTLEGSDAEPGGASAPEEDAPGAATTDPSPEARDADDRGGDPERDDDSLNVLSLLFSAVAEKLRGLFGRKG